MTKRYQNILTLLLLSLLPSFCLSQNNFTFRQFGHESVDFLKQPVNWKLEDWGKLGIIGLSTYLIMYADEPVRNEMLKDRSYYYSLPIEAARVWGEWYNTVIISGLFAASGIANNNYANKRLAFETMQSFLYTGFITGVLKFSLGRNRPYMNKGSHTYNPFSVNYDINSFASSHTSTAFSLSTILSQNSKSDLVKVLIYIPAFATAFSRMYQDQHWLSDTFMGAAIGYFIGVWIHKQHNQKDNFSPINQRELIFFRIAF